MSILSIRHLTRYHYRRPVGLGEHRMMLRPRESYDQRLLSFDVTIGPAPSRLRYVHDVFGNCVGVAEFAGRASELSFDARARLEHTPLPAFAGADGEIALYSGVAPFAYDTDDAPDLAPSMERAHVDPEGEIDRWARRFLRPDGATSLQSLLSEMTQAIYADFRYRKRLEGPAQTPRQTLALRQGTCRDFAVLMMEAARSLGLAAHFVSGYIYVPPPENPAHPGGRRMGGGHTHAWSQVYLPSCGWVEFDPTNGIIGNSDLIRVATVRNPRQATPLWGSWEGEAGDYLGMTVEVDLTMEPERDLDVA